MYEKKRETMRMKIKWKGGKAREESVCLLLASS